MRIGINALFLQKPTTGQGQHLIHLLRGLDQADHENSYVLLSPRLSGAYSINAPGLGPRFQEVKVVSALARFGENASKLWWEQVGIVRAAFREQIDLLHVPYWASPLFNPFPTVVTIHDVIQFMLPQYAWRQISRMYFWLVALAARRAQAIIAVSECSRRDIVKTIGIPASRIHVIGNAVDERLRPIADQRVLSGVQERYGIGRKYILYFGGFDLRKNVKRLIHAYARLPSALRREYQLVIAGRMNLYSSRVNAERGHPLYPDPRPLVPQLGLADQVVFTGQIREQDKAPLYSGATVFAFPSLYEGFGIPVLEAMACGAPVLTSNLSALPEVVGDAGLLVDPYSTDEIAAALQTLLEDPVLRGELSQKARARAQQFSWKQVAEQTVAVYQQVYAQSRR